MVSRLVCGKTFPCSGIFRSSLTVQGIASFLPQTFGSLAHKISKQSLSDNGIYASGRGLDWSVLSWCDWSSKCEKLLYVI